MYKPCVGGTATAAGTCELAATGSHTIQMMLVALLLSLGGGVLLRVSRLRRGND